MNGYRIRVLSAAGGTPRYLKSLPQTYHSFDFVGFINSPGSAPISEPKFESTPLVVGDTIFVTEPPATVVALRCKDGRSNLGIRTTYSCRFANRDRAGE